MKIAILGFGREGQSIYQHLKKDKTYQKIEFWILDYNKNIKLPEGVKGRLGPDYLDNLSQFNLIFRSPGIPYNSVLEKLKNNKNISSATKLFFEECPCPIIGVTGTKGKGTTSTLIYQILKNCGRDVYLAGNIGKSPLDILDSLSPTSLVVLELSSFQLQDLNKSPNYSIILDIFPDHMDVHKDMKEYVEAKSNIAKHQTEDDATFYFANNKYSFRIGEQGVGKKISIYHYIDKKLREELNKYIKIPGAHNWRNVQAAFTITHFLGCKKKNIFQSISEFHGNEHRLELVKELRGIKIYNDSASTNPETTIAAVKSFKEPKILIVGGKDKNLTYKNWDSVFKRNRVKAIILFGENKEKIKRVFSSEILKKVYVKNNLKEIIDNALRIAKKGDVVLFSPGAASFDMFESYADRGQKFKYLVKRL